MQTLRYCRTLYESTNIRCPLFLDSKNVGKRFGESVYIFSILIFAKFNTFCKIKRWKSRENVKNGITIIVCNNILSFGSHMKPTNLYLMTLNEIHILSHIGLQKQGGIQHSKNHDFFDKIEIKSPKIAWCNNKWQFWNGKTLRFPKIPDFWKFEWILPVLQSFIRWALCRLN